MVAFAFRKFGLIGASILSSLAFAGAADASVTITSAGLASPGGVNGTLTYQQPGPDYSVYAGIGEIALKTSTGDTLLSYCVDIFDELTPGTFTAANATTLNYDATKYGQVTALLTNAVPSDAAHSAAIQLALWEILYENGTYNLSSGVFSASNISQDAVDDANGYLQKITSSVWAANPNLQLAVLTDSGNQTQLVFGASAAKVLGAVPEPATWAMMIVGFGAIGASLRRRSDVSHGVAILG